MKTTDKMLLNTGFSFHANGLKPTHTTKDIEGNIVSESPEILFISTFPPRQCGIATYSQDLINALEKQFSGAFKYSICALASDSELHEYNDEQKPAYLLNTDEKNAFAKVAFSINKNEKISSVIIQHEFGLFAKNEEGFSLFFHSLKKPVVFVFHTVLPHPSLALKEQVQEMALVASTIVVMTKNASHILIKDYYIPDEKITVIPHGTHLANPLDKKYLKKKYNLTGRNILSTFGLLSANKGIEITLAALPAIIRKQPDVLFLVLGKTHPSVVKHEGEKYRNRLEEMVIELQLEHHVRFVNEYLPLPVLLEYLQLTDVYLFTSNDPNQAVSGTFSYAMSAGCPIISTPIPHAKELVDKHTGLLFDFNNTYQLAEAALLLLNNRSLRKSISLNALHKMASTAWENAAIAHAGLFADLHPETMKLIYQIPPVNLNHIKNMTTDFGMIQFAKIATPDIDTGYTLDDNARALIAFCQLYESTRDADNLILINTYFQFIKYCMQTNGMFLNYVDVNKNFTKQNDAESLEDSNGRAVWAIGYLISLKEILPIPIIEEAELLMEEVIQHIDKMHSTRTMAFMIKGLYHQNDAAHFYLIKLLADRLLQMYRHERNGDWYWFESYLTYGNSVLPEAMLCAYLSTQDEVYKNIAKESFDFLLSKIFSDDKIAVITNQGWMYKDEISERRIGGEQPIDVAYTILTLEKFYGVFGEAGYKQKAIIAFNWFLGANHLNQIVYNPRTGGCYDGVEEYNVNLNQGAESTLSYLMARLAIERIGNMNQDINVSANLRQQNDGIAT